MGTQLKSTTIIALLLTVINIYGGNYFVITENGVPRTKIIIKNNASQVEKFAATELQKYVKEMSGAELIIKETNDFPPPPLSGSIIIGKMKTNSLLLPILGNPRLPENDCFIIRLINNNLILAGGNARGTLYAVYELLEELGCRWFFPKKEWEIIPRLKSIKLTGINKTEIPHFKNRELWAGKYDWLAKNKGNRIPVWWPYWNGEPEYYIKNGKKYKQRKYSVNYRDYLKEGKKRGIKCSVAADNSVDFWLPASKYFNSHPEFYPLVRGKRTASHIDLQKEVFTRGFPLHQFCFSSKGGEKEIADNMSKLIVKYPDIDTLGLYLTDRKDTGFCDCEKCVYLHKKFMPPQSVDHTGEYIYFANNIAALLSKTNPEVMIELSAYEWSSSLEAPINIKPAPNTKLVFWNYMRGYARPLKSTASSRNYYINSELLKYLNLFGGERITVTDYYYGMSCYFNFIWPIFDIIKTDMAYYHNLGINGIRAFPGSHFSHFLNTYLALRLAWNTNLDINEILDDFCQKAFMQAASPMKCYINILRKSLKDIDFKKTTQGNSSYKGWKNDFVPTYENLFVLLKPETLEQLNNCLIAAKKLAKNNDDVLKRLELVEKEFSYNYFIIKANEFKMQGDTFLKGKKYDAALNCYRNALETLDDGKKDGQNYSKINFGKSVRDVLLLTENIIEQKRINNIAQNASAENITVDNKGNSFPASWGCYKGAGICRWGSSCDFIDGKRSAFIENLEEVNNKNEKKVINNALVQGNSNGYTGENAYNNNLPGEQVYFVSFWLKGEKNPKVTVFVRGWTAKEAGKETRKQIKISRIGKSFIAPVDWTEYRGFFRIDQNIKKFALMFHLSSLGKIYVDNICIAPLSKNKIALYIPQMDGGKGDGCSAILTTLKKEKLKIIPITDLSSNISQYKSLIFPQVNQLGNSQKGKPWVKNIRNYVSKGGNAYFYHDSCGYKPHGWILGNTSVFPEICKGVKRKVGSKNTPDILIVCSEHPVVKGHDIGYKGTNSYWDHMELIPGTNAEVLVKDGNDNPVVIVGNFGKGKVVFDGTIPYDATTETELKEITGIQKDILLNFIQWSTKD